MTTGESSWTVQDLHVKHINGGTRGIERYDVSSSCKAVRVPGCAAKGRMANRLYLSSPSDMMLEVQYSSLSTYRTSSTGKAPTAWLSYEPWLAVHSSLPPFWHGCCWNHCWSLRKILFSWVTATPSFQILCCEHCGSLFPWSFFACVSTKASKLAAVQIFSLSSNTVVECQTDMSTNLRRGKEDVVLI